MDNKNYKKITSTEILDIYRIDYGVILEVHKYIPKVQVYGIYNKRKCLKLANNIYQTKEDLKLGNNEIIANGSYIIKDILIEKVINIDEYKFELKLSGGSLYGDIEKFSKYINVIQEITDSYHKEKVVKNEKEY